MWARWWGLPSVNVKRPLAPARGAENVMSAPGTGFFCASVAVTASRIGNGLPTEVDCVEPTPRVSLEGLPARFESEKLTGVRVGAAALPGLSFPLPPPLETEAVAVNEPAAVFAMIAGEVARPLASVLAVVWVPPPAKLAPATEAVPQVPALAGSSMNVTVAPATGLPLVSRTLTCNGFGKRPPTVADLRMRGIAVSRAGMPAAVLVNENETEPYCELAVTM